jgi:hypothetical protein
MKNYAKSIKSLWKIIKNHPFTDSLKFKSLKFLVKNCSIFNNFFTIGQNIMKRNLSTPNHQGFSNNTKSIARDTLISKISSTWLTNKINKLPSFIDRFQNKFFSLGLGINLWTIVGDLVVLSKLFYFIKLLSHIWSYLHQVTCFYHLPSICLNSWEKCRVIMQWVACLA